MEANYAWLTESIVDEKDRRFSQHASAGVQITLAHALLPRMIRGKGTGALGKSYPGDGAFYAATLTVLTSALRFGSQTNRIFGKMTSHCAYVEMIGLVTLIRPFEPHAA